MRALLRIAAVIAACWLGWSASADAPLIYCVGSHCGGNGPCEYAYRVDSVSYPMIEFRVGTSDLNLEDYTNVLIPAGRNFEIDEYPMSHACGLHAHHGEYSDGPCYSVTPGSVHWWTDAPEYAVEFFTFGFDHPWTSEDVGWEETARREGPEYYTFYEDWGYMVGIWYGPVHGPYGPYGDLNHDLCVDQRDLGLFLADWGCDAGWCIGDLDWDGDTDQADLGILLGDWGCTGAGCLGDADGDGDTDQSDLGVLLANWGASCW